MQRLPWRDGRNYPVLVARHHNSGWRGVSSDLTGLSEYYGFCASRKEADTQAALRIVKDVVDRLYLMKIKLLCNQLEAKGVSSPILIAPHKISSPNRLATTARDFIGEHTGLSVDSNIIERPCDSIHGLSKLQRIFKPPEFEGTVKKGEWYLAVDDNISSGVTMASLRSHIVENGGRFVGGLALSSPTGKDTTLNASHSQIEQVVTRLGEEISNWAKSQANVCFDGLTRSEASFLGSRDGRQQLLSKLAASRRLAA